MVIILNGDLGSGKTFFTKKFGSELGVENSISSPTFLIVKEYQGKIPLYHMDVYRLGENSTEDYIEEYFYKNGVSIVEWGEFISSILPDEYLEINIKIDGAKRIFTLIPKGKKYKEIIDDFIY